VVDFMSLDPSQCLSSVLPKPRDCARARAASRSIQIAASSSRSACLLSRATMSSHGPRTRRHAQAGGLVAPAGDSHAPSTTVEWRSETS
jgi:hypothetical protein